jgi:hypothetical protein
MGKWRGVMPKIGEIRSARQIGKVGGARHIWHACIDCGKKRWVCLRENKPTNLFCHTCAGKHIFLRQAVEPSSVIHYRETHPCHTLAQIGSNYGLTRERVRQILKGNGAVTVHVPVPKQQYICLNCGEAFTPYLHVHHGRTIGSIEFCSGACSKEYHSITLVCDQCGKEFKRPQRFVLLKTQPHKYTCCSRECYGRLLGNKFGFGVYPDHHGNGGGAKLSESQALQLIEDKANGMSVSQLMLKYNIGNTTLYNYLKRFKA